MRRQYGPNGVCRRLIFACCASTCVFFKLAQNSVPVAAGGMLPMGSTSLGCSSQSTLCRVAGLAASGRSQPNPLSIASCCLINVVSCLYAAIGRCLSQDMPSRKPGCRQSPLARFLLLVLGIYRLLPTPLRTGDRDHVRPWLPEESRPP